MKDVRSDFPLLSHHPKLVYLDSACTSLKPVAVIEAEMSYYTQYGACAGRSAHDLARKTSGRLERAREAVSSFVGGDPAGLVWTRNATEALNLIASSFDFSSRRRVVTTEMEHHAAILPFLRLEQEGKAELTILKAGDDGEIPLDAWQEAVGRDTALLVTNCGTNTTGRSCDGAALARIAHDSGALLCMDGAQGVPHAKVDMKRSGYDFLCFSAHKMCGPTGVGAMIASKDALTRLGTYMVGGGTVRTVSGKEASYMEDRTRFEAGIQDYAGIFGFEAACAYLDGIGMDEVQRHEKAVGGLMRKAIEDAGARVYGDLSKERCATYSFNFPKAKAHDVALMLNKDDIALRSGFFCAQPAMEAMGARGGAVRASAYIYNNDEDIRRFSEAMGKLAMLYG